MVFKRYQISKDKTTWDNPMAFLARNAGFIISPFPTRRNRPISAGKSILPRHVHMLLLHFALLSHQYSLRVRIHYNCNAVLTQSLSYHYYDVGLSQEVLRRSRSYVDAHFLLVGGPGGFPATTSATLPSSPATVTPHHF